ncbi:hypothetical protein ABW20_dc0101781 [Dactylellina cionopaga]|nr:hypothetical protein ABW20_dc0101781 [Dactylellina cionopaga]
MAAIHSLPFEEIASADLAGAISDIAPHYLSESTQEEDSEDLGYEEETIVKIKALYLLVQLLLLRETVFKPGFESSVSSSRSSPYETSNLPCDGSTDGGGNAHDNSQTDGTTIESSSSPPVSQTQSKAHKQKNYEGAEGGDDMGQTPPRRAAKYRPRFLAGRFACTFAKADPVGHSSCLLIARKDLSGVK